MKLDVCGGCNAKIGPGDLGKILKNISILKRDDVLVGFEGNEDASIIKINDEVAMVFTLDFFPTMVEDPRSFGRIAAANALSDIYAMGAEPVSALNIVCFPEGEDLKILEEILKGGAEIVEEAGATLSGGHSIHDGKIKYGLSAIGKVHPEKIYRNNTPNLGDYLILTKPLGVSLLCNGFSVGEISEKDYLGAVKSMEKLNKYSMDILKNYPLSSVTDVTGFSLIGHLLEMVGENFTTLIDSKSIKILPGAKNAAREFLYTAGGQRNRRAYENRVSMLTNDKALEEVLYDPQTSGGILAAIPGEFAEEALKKLIDDNIEASIIGYIGAREDEIGVEIV